MPLDVIPNPDTKALLEVLTALPALATAPAAETALAASNDAEAASAWLSARAGRSPATFDSYRREAARLLMWLGERGLGLRDMKIEHAHEFYGFLADPPPHWLRPRKPGREARLAPTQLLAGPLQPRSVAFSRTVLGLMAEYLQDAGYLRYNVFRLSARPAVVDKAMAARSLDPETWGWLWHWILQMPRGSDREKAHAVRARWLMALLYHTGIRREEAAHALMGDFDRRGRQWSLRVVGKGKRERFVTVSSALLHELVTYRTAMGLENAYPVPTETIPVVASITRSRSYKPMTPRAIGLIVAEICESAAAACTDDEHIQARVARVSTHWMRHTNATHRLKAGASLVTTQDELGHRDTKTTRLYTKSIDEERWTDAEKLAGLVPTEDSEATKTTGGERR